MSQKERCTSISNYVSQPLKAAPQVKPLHALFVMLIRAPMGSQQNWPAVREWAGQVGALRVTFIT